MTALITRYLGLTQAVVFIAAVVFAVIAITAGVWNGAALLSMLLFLAFVALCNAEEARR